MAYIMYDKKDDRITALVETSSNLHYKTDFFTRRFLDRLTLNELNELNFATEELKAEVIEFWESVKNE